MRIYLLIIFSGSFFLLQNNIHAQGVTDTNHILFLKQSKSNFEERETFIKLDSIKSNSDTIKLLNQPSSSENINNIKIYPNPASLSIHFILNPDYTPTEVDFYDLMGRRYFPKYTLENNTLSSDVHEFADGIYIAIIFWRSKLTWSDGQYFGSLTSMFIIQH